MTKRHSQPPPPPVRDSSRSGKGRRGGRTKESARSRHERGRTKTSTRVSFAASMPADADKIPGHDACGHASSALALVGGKAVRMRNLEDLTPGMYRLRRSCVVLLRRDRDDLGLRIEVPVMTGLGRLHGAHQMGRTDPVVRLRVRCGGVWPGCSVPALISRGIERGMHVPWSGLAGLVASAREVRGRPWPAGSCRARRL